MNEQLVVLETPAELEAAQRELADVEYIAFDTETTGTSKSDLIIGVSFCSDDTKAYYAVLGRWDAAKQQLDFDIAMKYPITEFLQFLATKKLICHNGVFDCMMVEFNFNVKLIDALHTDTMVLAHLLDENRRVGLKELATSMFGESSTGEQKEMKASIEANGGKMTKAQYELYKADYKLIAKYGAKDALLTYKLFINLIPELFEQKLDKFFYDDESMPLLRTVTYPLNTTGLKIDTTALVSLKRTLEAENMVSKAFVHREIQELVKDKYPGTSAKTTFNVASSQQLAWLLFEKLEYEFGTLTDKGKEVCKELEMKLPYSYAAKRQFTQAIKEHNAMTDRMRQPRRYKEPWVYMQCNKAVLAKYAHKREWIAELLKFQKNQKILTTYVKGIEAKIKYGIIQPSFLQHGTTSGRYASKNPNFQNLPRSDRRVKSFVVAREGKVFVGADYSQLEPRVFASLCGDTKLRQAFDGDTDFYSVIGIEVFDKYDATPHKEGASNAFGVKYKELRDLSKVIALASSYGATAWQLAPTTKKSVEQTQEIINTYFERFPDVKRMMLECHKQAKTQGVSYNHFGRPRRIPEAKQIERLYGKGEHAELPYQARNLLNLSVNHKIQSTGASIVNRAAIAFSEKAKDIDCKLVLQVHDSLVVECSEADAPLVAALLQDAMENTTCLPGVRLEAVPKIGKTLAEV
jgi:DNA polymerase-1